MRNKIISISHCLTLIFALVACTPSVNKANFDRIQQGMTVTQVIAILGKPTNTSTLTVGSVTGSTVRWVNRNGVISIQFFNNRVKIKQFAEGVTTPKEL